jgi:hypothetical protein
MEIAILIFLLDGKQYETVIGAAPRLTNLAVVSGLDEAQSMYCA